MGQSRFYEGIFCNKGDGIGPFNLAVYWKRKYRQKGPKEPWYILTNLPTLKQALAIYRCRWGIEPTFRTSNWHIRYLERKHEDHSNFLWPDFH